MFFYFIKSKSTNFILPITALFGLLVFLPQLEARGMSIFNGNPTAEKCRLCHGDDNKQPHPLLQEVNADKHHGRIGEPIRGLGRGMYDTIAPGDTSSGVYECFTCHSYDYENSQIVLETDCLACHPAYSVTGRPMRGGNVHHTTDAFRSRQCRMCHGFIQRNYDSDTTGDTWGRGGRGGMGGGRGGMGGRW